MDRAERERLRGLVQRWAVSGDAYRAALGDDKRWRDKITSAQDGAEALRRIHGALDPRSVLRLLDECDRLQREVDQLTGELQAARSAHALPHLYEGGCPDDMQPDARDALCPACRAMGPAPSEGASDGH